MCQLLTHTPQQKDEWPRRRAANQRDELAPFHLTEMHPIPSRAGSTSQDIGLQRISQRVCERFTTPSPKRPVGRQGFPQRSIHGDSVGGSFRANVLWEEATVVDTDFLCHELIE